MISIFFYGAFSTPLIGTVCIIPYCAWNKYFMNWKRWVIFWIFAVDVYKFTFCTLNWAERGLELRKQTESLLSEIYSCFAE